MKKKTKEKYDEGSHISHSFYDELRYKLKMSRNVIRAFGWNTGFVSGELLAKKDKPWTYDHINGMVTIITSTAMKIIDESFGVDEVVDYLDRMSCVIKVSQKLNTTKLKKLQTGKITPKEYYNTCEGIFTKDGYCFDIEEFNNKCGKYFISNS